MRAWTNKEHAEFERLLGEGKNCRQVSVALNRSYCSIRSRVAARGLSQKRLCVLRAPRQPTTIITKADVPDWYAIGWRFAGFDGDGHCIMYWPHRCEPMFIEGELRAAA